jgi:ammonia channel protein AmtB
LALGVIVVWDGLATFGILKLIGLVVPLRLPQLTLEGGDRVIHGETAYDDDELAGRHPAPGWVLPIDTVPAEEAES